MTTPDLTNIVICPHCSAENIEGTDTCENCSMDLRTVDVPESVRVDSGSDLLQPISAVRVSKVTTVPTTATVARAIEAMRSAGNGAVVVVEGSRVVGIFSERDVLKKIAARPEGLDEPVTSYMTPDPVVLRDDDTVATALNKMGDGGFRHIPVTRDGRLIGMVTGRDVLNWIMQSYFD